jgi:hypothetical protein
MTRNRKNEGRRINEKRKKEKKGKMNSQKKRRKNEVHMKQAGKNKVNIITN